MKYPSLQPFGDVLPLLTDFDAIIDVRSPAEFAEDHLPGAINCPVLDDDQRVQVGTMYKTVSAFEAKKLGATLVAKNIAHHIESHFQRLPQDWKPLIYCWRGGNRSGAMALIFARIGWPVTQLDGGYKAYRNYVNTELAVLPQALSFNVLCGPTGSGKSRLLRLLEGQGAQVLDLEKLAAHRGSVLGDLPTSAQPSQKRFESLLWELLSKFDPARPIFVEAESKKVGKLRVPELLMEKMRSSPCIKVELAIADRVALLMQEYPHFIEDPVLLNTKLDFLTDLHGNEKIAHWHQLALNGQAPELVDELLRRHYDPGYLQSIRRNFQLLDQAESLALTDISEDTFQRAARYLNATADNS